MNFSSKCNSVNLHVGTWLEVKYPTKLSETKIRLQLNDDLYNNGNSHTDPVQAGRTSARNGSIVNLILINKPKSPLITLFYGYAYCMDLNINANDSF